MYPVDASGTETPNFHDLNCAYQQISLSNVPFDKDLCFPANPLNTYLEMFADVARFHLAKQEMWVVVRDYPHMFVLQFPIDPAQPPTKTSIECRPVWNVACEPVFTEDLEFITFSTATNRYIVAAPLAPSQPWSLVDTLPRQN